MNFAVINIIDGNTFEISPLWSWNNQAGRVIRARGYNAPESGEPGYQAAKDKITDLILNEQVELANPIELTDGRLLCDVEYNGRNLADYFPEYK